MDLEGNETNRFSFPHGCFGGKSLWTCCRKLHVTSNKEIRREIKQVGYARLSSLLRGGIKSRNLQYFAERKDNFLTKKIRESRNRESGWIEQLGVIPRYRLLHTSWDDTLLHKLHANVSSLDKFEACNPHQRDVKLARVFFPSVWFLHTSHWFDSLFLPTPRLNRGRASHLSFQADLLAASSSFCLLFF